MLEVIVLHAYSFIPIFLELCTVHHRSSGVRSEMLVLLAYGTAYSIVATLIFQAKSVKPYPTLQTKLWYTWPQIGVYTGTLAGYITIYLVFTALRRCVESKARQTMCLPILVLSFTLPHQNSLI